MTPEDLTGNPELRDLIRRAAAEQWGTTCTQLWARAQELAESLGETRALALTSVELVTARAQTRNYSEAVPGFLRCEELVTEHPDWFDDYCKESHAWNFKYVTSAVRCNPNVPVDQCMAILNRMGEFYNQIGDSGRAVWVRRWYMHDDCGDPAQADEAYHTWQTKPRTDLADCFACEPEYPVEYESFHGNWEAALKAGEEALAIPANSQPQCGDQPEALKTKMLETWVRTGHDDKAWAAHVAAWARHRTDPRVIMYHNLHLRYLALTGAAGRPERLQRGHAILVRYLPWWSKLSSHTDLMRIAAAAAVITKALPDRDAPFGADLSPDMLAWWDDAPTLVNPTISQAQQWFETLALDIAEAFDNRPGLTVARHVERVKKLLNPTPVDPLPARGPVIDITGTAGEIDIDYRIVDTSSATAEATTDPVKQPETATPAGDGGYVAIDINDPVRRMHGGALIAEAEKTIAVTGSAPSSFPAMVVLEKALAQADLEQRFREVAANEGAPGDPARRLARYVTATIDSLRRGDDGYDIDPDEPRSDASWAQMARAELLSEDKKFMEAAQLADSLMRKPSADPIGLRIQGLSILTDAALKAGYASEALPTARELVNVTAALNLPTATLGASVLMSQVLLALKRPAEAAEVLEAALMRVDGIDIGAAEAAVRRGLAKALSDADIDRDAGEELLSAARIFTSLGQHDRALDALEDAARCFAWAQDADYSVATADRIIGELERRLADPGNSDEETDTLVKRKEQALLFALKVLSTQQAGLTVTQSAHMDALFDRFHAVVQHPGYRSRKASGWEIARSWREEAHIRLAAGQYVPARDSASMALNGFTDCGDQLDRAETLMVLATIEAMAGDSSEAVGYARRILSETDENMRTMTIRSQAQQLITQLTGQE
ncbi:hypothetical protein ACFSSC_06245 [Corynebacterium mendelii]|uniref:Tetratricopeptide repeat protein n=1 Tax=Corynebacterium mendelii TaxID=2765362 RepID=A0A939E186_9CORY|nr:hypothetical protein [Corynebacterium mendelii]MBN9644580.1 hypothetical protein [Corynebacterium mendelii]